MKTFLPIFLIISALSFNNAYAQAGSLDPTFGTDGRVGEFFYQSRNFLREMVIQADGKIVACGDLSFGYDNNYFLIVRYMENGDVDTTFGSQGNVATLVGAKCAATCIALQADGKIIVGGYTSNAIGNSGNFDPIVIRYLESGEPDTTFGTDGIITFPDDSGTSVNKVAVQADGKILLGAGSGMYRLLSDGSLDSDFNENGHVSMPRYVSDFKLLNDDKILVASGGGGILLCKYNNDGSVDDSFGTNGRSFTTLPNNFILLADMEVADDGEILIIGDVLDPTYKGALVKFDADGALATTFGDNGSIIITTPEGILSHGTNVIMNNGKIVAGYGLGPSGNYDFNIRAYDMNGVPDTTFGTDGISNIFFTDSSGRTGHDYLEAMTVQADGKILAGGNTYMGGFSIARLMPVDVTAGTDAFAIATNKFTVYPNPATAASKLQIDLTDSSALTLKLYDTKGMFITTLAENKMVVQGKTEFPLDITALAKGVYFLTITTPDKVTTIRVVN